MACFAWVGPGARPVFASRASLMYPARLRECSGCRLISAASANNDIRRRRSPSRKNDRSVDGRKISAPVDHSLAYSSVTSREFAVPAPRCLHIYYPACAPVVCSSCNQLPKQRASPHPSTCHWHPPLGKSLCGPSCYALPSAVELLPFTLPRPSVGLAPIGTLWIQYMQQGASALDAFC